MDRTGRRDGTRGWVVGRVVGAPVVVSPGWVVAAVVLTVLFAPTVRSLVAVTTPGSYGVAAAFVLLLLGSVFLHELAHAVVARRRGVLVRELAVTLLGGHTQLGGAAPTPATSALVAAAGPVVNLLLGGAAWLAAELLPVGGVPWLLLVAAALANGFVGLFNLVPGLPLDGGRVLEALVWRVTGERWRGSVVAGHVGRVVAVGVLAWVLLRPLVEGRQVRVVDVVWGALVGAFLWTGADQAVRTARADRRVDGLTIQSLVRPALVVPARGTLADLDAAAARTPDAVRDVVLVAGDGRAAGRVDAAAALAVPPDRRATTPLGAVSVPLPPGAVVPAGLRGPEAVRAVGEAVRHAPVVAVVDHDQVVGVLRSRDVVDALRA